MKTRNFYVAVDKKSSAVSVYTNKKAIPKNDGAYHFTANAHTAREVELFFRGAARGGRGVLIL